MEILEFCKQCPHYKKKYAKSKVNIEAYYHIVNITKEVFPKKVFFIYEKIEQLDALVPIAEQYKKDEIEIVIVPLTHCLKTKAHDAVEYCWNTERLNKVKSMLHNNLLVFLGRMPLKSISAILNDESLHPDDIPQNTLVQYKDMFIMYAGTAPQLAYNDTYYLALREAIDKWNTIISSDEEIVVQEQVIVINKKDITNKFNNVIVDQAKAIEALSYLIEHPEIPTVYDLETVDTVKNDVTLEFWHPKAKPVLMSFAYNSDTSYVLLLDETLFNTNKATVNIIIQLLQELFTQPNRVFVNHNIKFDTAFMFKYLKLDNSLLIKNSIRLVETKLLARLYNTDKDDFRLGALAADYLNYTSWKDILPQWRTYYVNNYPTNTYDVKNDIVDLFVKYAGLDALITYELYEFLMNKLSQTPLYKLAYIFSYIESGLMYLILNGNRIDMDKLQEFGTFVKTRLTEIDKELRSIVLHYSGNNEDYANNFNFNSNPQISNFLIKYCGLEIALKYPEFVTSKTHDIRISDDTIEPMIQKLNITGDIKRFLELLLERVKLSKQYNSYYKPYNTVLKSTPPDEKGHYYIYPSIDTAGTVTGRLSTANPNTQQLPREGFVRQLFISRYDDGYILSIDYSQAEVRMLALVTQDPELLNVFEYDRDPYKDVATVIFNKTYDDITKEERNACKPILLAAIYGRSPKSLAKVLGITVEDATNRYNKFLGKYKYIKRYHEFLRKIVQKHGYIYFASYRQRHFDFIIRALREGRSRYYIDQLIGKVWTKIINAPIQGATSDLALYNFARLNTAVVKNNLNAKWILTVHDSIVFDVDSVDTAFKVYNLAGNILPELHPLVIEYMDEHFGAGNWRPVKMAFDAELGHNYGKYHGTENPEGVRDIVEYIN